MSKYRVTMANIHYYTADIEANSPKEAEEIAKNNYLTELGTSITAYDGDSYVVEDETYEVKEENI